MSQEGFADKLGVSRRAVTTWHERPDSVVRPELQQALDTLFESAAEPARVRFAHKLGIGAQPADAAPAASTQPVAGPLVLPAVDQHVPVEFDDPDDYVESVRANVTRFVSLDNSFGGGEIVRLSTRYFAGLHAHLGTATYQPRIMRDLHSAAGELAEVVGWLAYDAEQHDLARRMNQESLHYTRLAGDKTLELLTLQNMSMHAAAQGRPGEALHIVRSVLEGDYQLTPRLKALFVMRKARALAQGGDDSAVKLMAEVRGRYEDGVTDRDPGWAWWIDERELDWHEAMILRDLGRSGVSLAKFEESAAGVPPDEMRSQYVHRAHLFQSQIETGAWQEAEQTLTQLRSLSVEVASTRATVLLLDTLASEPALGRAPKKFVEQARRLESTLKSTPV
jgi:hypothetical protein